MGARIEEISLKQAARRLEVHYNTALAWALEGLSGGDSRFAKGTLRRDIARRIWVREEEVDRLRQEALQEAIDQM